MSVKILSHQQAGKVGRKKHYKRKNHMEKRWKGALGYILCVFPFLIQKPSITETSIEEWGSLLYVWTEHYPYKSKTFRTGALL